MPKCSYCGKLYDEHKGLSFVLVDGTLKHLCSSKCRKNMLMKRRKVRWVLKNKKEKSSEQVISKKIEEKNKTSKIKAEVSEKVEEKKKIDEIKAKVSEKTTEKKK